MKLKLRDIKDKAQMAVAGVVKVLSMPRYGILSVALAFGFATLIYFFIQIGFYGSLLASRLPFTDKIGVVGSMIQQMVNSFGSSLDGFLLLLVAVLQGIAFAVMIYTMRRNKRVDMETVGRSGIAMFATAIGLGCVPCGTSLIMPVITLLFSSSAYAVANTASLVVLIIAFCLSLYSLYRLGYVAYVHAAVEESKEEGKDDDEKK